MGWDAYTSAKIDWISRPPRMVDDKLNAQFCYANDQCRKEHGSADGGLSFGMLDCSTTAVMLQHATGFSCWDPEGWSAEKVKSLHDHAKWNFSVKKDEMWAYESAKAFLRICAENNLSITFSW